MFSIVMKFVYNPVNLFQDQTPITFLINFLLLTFLLSKLPTTNYLLPTYSSLQLLTTNSLTFLISHSSLLISPTSDYLNIYSFYCHKLNGFITFALSQIQFLLPVVIPIAIGGKL